MVNEWSNKQIISYALNMWYNYIQTGDITISPEDAKNMNQENLISPLTEEQMEFVLRLKKLSRKVLEL